MTDKVPLPTRPCLIGKAAMQDVMKDGGLVLDGHNCGMTIIRSQPDDD